MKEKYSELYFWRPKSLFGKRNNFGDYLSLVIYSFLKNKFFDNGSIPGDVGCIGSILHLLPAGSAVLGSGWNGKIIMNEEIIERLKTFTFYGMRGPLTQKFLLENQIYPNSNDPIFYGDPAILLPDFYSPKHEVKQSKAIWIPNLNEVSRPYSKELVFVSPLSHWKRVVQEIQSSSQIITSSLHGFILAEAYSKQVKLVLPRVAESEFKYLDYLHGSGRSQYSDLGSARDYREFISLDSGLFFPKPEFMKKKMYNNFSKFFSAF